MNLPAMRSLSAAAVASALLLAGCGAASDESADDGPRAVAAFYPLAYVTERVAGEHVEVDNLTQVGGEPHGLELTVKETADVSAADLVVFESGFQPAVDDVLSGGVDGVLVDAVEVVELRPVTDHSEEGHADGHEDEHDHEHGDVDPHFWLDPLLMADLGDAVAEGLAEVDPERAQEFSDNAADLRADLEALDLAYADGLAACERDTVVVHHDAFGYLARYGLHLEPIVGLSPDAEATPADLGRLQRLIRTEGITTVFAESLVDSAAADSLAGDLGLEVAVLDPIEGLTDRTRDEDYLSLMRSNLDTLTEANGC